MKEYFGSPHGVNDWRREWCYVMYPSKYEEWAERSFYRQEVDSVYGQIFVHHSLEDDGPIYSILDYTHNINRLRTFTSAGRVPGVNPQAWKEVAKAKDSLNKPATSLTLKMLSSGGGDMMSIVQTRTFFSMKVSSLMYSLG